MNARRAAGCGYAEVTPLTDPFVETLRTGMGDALVGVALYGSVARGEARPESDIDLLVVHLGGRVAALDAVRAVRQALYADPVTERLCERGVPVDLSYILFSESQFADTRWLLLDVSHHGIILFDPRGVLSRKLAALRARLEELGSRRIELPNGDWYWDIKPDMRPGEIVHL